MRIKRVRKRLAFIPCRLRHSDSTLLKLTVFVCLVFPGYIFLFNHFSNLGAIRAGTEHDLTLERTLHVQPLKSTERASLRQSRLIEEPLLEDISQRKNLREDDGSQDAARWRDLLRGQGSTNSSHQKVQVISGTRVLYLGCYRDETERTLRALREGFSADIRRMTVPMCIRHCAKRGSYYAGLEFRSECYCGKRIYHRVPANESLCNAPCAGNETEICGGAPYLSVYQLLDEKGNKQVQQRDTSDTGIADKFRACLPRPAVSAKQSVFPGGYFISDDKLTVNSCMSKCLEKKLPLAALGAGTECHCGFFTSDYRMQKVLSPEECDIPCRGDENYFCGGDGAVSVYQTSAKDTRCRNITLRPDGTLPVVALASFPGSGNTWARYLIERATGIYTGSIYNDGVLFKQGFMGERENWKKGNTICIKTHRFDEKHVQQFDAAIVIIRNPFNALISEHNRKFGGHVGFAPISQYTKGTEWSSFVTGSSRSWANLAVNYIQYSKRLHVVYYEDLQTNLYDTVKGMVNFLNLPVDEERLLCVLSTPLGKFKRPVKPQIPLAFDPFTGEMHEMVDLSRKTVSMALKLKNCTGLPKDYDPQIQL